MQQYRKSCNETAADELTWECSIPAKYRGIGMEENHGEEVRQEIDEQTSRSNLDTQDASLSSKREANPCQYFCFCIIMM
jgi:hypothetical protein